MGANTPNYSSLSLYGIRHGTTPDDVPGQERPSGWRASDLTPKGIEHVTNTGKFLADNAHLHHLFTSDLLRAQHSANIIGSITGAKVHPVGGFRGWHMGIFEGQPETVVKPYLKYYAAHPDLVVPGGESKGSALSRFHRSLTTLQALSEQHPDLDFAFVTHSHNFNDLPMVLGRRDGPISGDLIPPAGIVHIRRDQHGRWSAEPIVVNKGEVDG